MIRDRALAIRTAILNARAGDIILLSGKGHEKYEIDAKGKHPFDEKMIAAKAAYERYSRGRIEMQANMEQQEQSE